jgi:hypothetical protein
MLSEIASLYSGKGNLVTAFLPVLTGQAQPSDFQMAMLKFISRIGGSPLAHQTASSLLGQINQFGLTPEALIKFAPNLASMAGLHIEGSVETLDDVLLKVVYPLATRTVEHAEANEFRPAGLVKCPKCKFTHLVH